LEIISNEGQQIFEEEHIMESQENTKFSSLIKQKDKIGQKKVMVSAV
jgi:hypothetical protein